MHIAVVLQHYGTPGCGTTARHYRLAEHWAQHHDVTLVTSSAWRAAWQDRTAPEAPPGVRLVEVDVPYANAMTPGQRSLAFARFGLLALGHTLRVARPDVLLGVSTPLSVPAITALAARRHRIPWMLEVQDLWPMFPIQMGAVRQQVVQKSLVQLERRLYRHADHVVTLSPDMTEHVRAAGQPASRVTTSFNGTDVAEAAALSDAERPALRRALGLGDGPVVMYAGTFGRANNLPLLIRMAEYLQAHRPEATLVCLGDGYGRAYLDAAAERLPVLRIVGPRPRTEIFQWFRAADLSAVTFNDLPVLGTNSPAKLYDSLASGTPALVVNDGWMRTLVESEACGFYSSAAVPNAVAETVVRLLAAPDALARARQNAHALVARRPEIFDRHLIAEQYLGLFERLVQDRAGRGAAGGSGRVGAGARVHALAAAAA